MEDLEKAAGGRVAKHRRKKSGKTLSPHEASRAVHQVLMENKHLLSADAKKQLEETRDHLRQKAKGAPTKTKSTFDPDSVAKEHAKKQAQQLKQEADVKTHVEKNPEKVKHYSTGGSAPQPEMRSKQAGKVSGPIRRRLTGEDVAIRDQAQGAAMDAGAKLKSKEKAAREKAKPEAFRIPKEEVVKKSEVESISKNELVKALEDQGHHQSALLLKNWDEKNYLAKSVEDQLVKAKYEEGADPEMKQRIRRVRDSSRVTADPLAHKEFMAGRRNQKATDRDAVVAEKVHPRKLKSGETMKNRIKIDDKKKVANVAGDPK
jgi:hypothetical protein